MSLVFVCLTASLHNMNGSEEDKLMTRPRLYPGPPSVLSAVQSGYLAASLPPPSPSRQCPTSEGTDDSIYVLPHSPPQKPLTSSINGEIRVRREIRLITQMADGDKISGLSLHKSCEF